MKKLNELKRKIYLDIFFTVCLVLISIPLWQSFSIFTFDDLASRYENYNYIEYEFLNEVQFQNVVMSDNNALKNIETQDIVVSNYYSVPDDYILLLKINKTDILANPKMKININYQINYLDNFKHYEDGIYYVYILDTNSLMENSQKYIISMWNDESYNVEKTNDLDCTFLINNF